jgi:hypothetical protein
MAAPFVAGSLALLESARPNLTQAQLRDALLASATHAPEVAGRVGAGELNVGAAMHAVVPGRWDAPVRAHIAQVSTGVRVFTARKARMTHKVRVRWSRGGASNVTTWLVKLDGRNIVTVGADGRRAAACWAQSAGRHKWTVVGLDATGSPVVRAAKTFRAV